MRFLIVATAIFACAAAAPSGALLAAPYASGIISSAPLAVAAAVPTIPPGDIQAAAIDAQVYANNNARAAVDAAQQYHDQAAEIQGRAYNYAEGHAWQALTAAQTAQAQIDGAAANVAPVAARSLVAPAAYAAPVAVAAPAVAAPAYAAAAYAAPAIAAYTAPAIAAPAIAAPAIAAPVVAARAYAPAVVAGSQSISTQSLSQTHPAPVVAAPVAYAAHGLAHGLAHAW